MGVLPIVSLVLSVGAFLWSFALTVVRWPRIAVEIRQSVVSRVIRGPDGSPTTGSVRDTFKLTIVNRGSEAVTITNIGLRDEGTNDWLDYETTWFHQGKQPSGRPESSLPARLEGQGCLIWTYSDDLMTKFPYGAVIVGFADRYKAFRWWPWWPRRRASMVRRTTSRQAVCRNGGGDPSDPLILLKQ